MSFLRIWVTSSSTWRIAPASVSSCPLLRREHGARVLHRVSRLVQNEATSPDLAWVSADNREEVSRVLELASRASSRWDITWTEFLSPAVVGDAMAALGGRADVAAVPWGGYAQAERCRLAMGRDEILSAMKDDPAAALGEESASSSSGAVAAMEVKGNFIFDVAKHPDFLGAILGTGVVRGKVGDILVQGETGAQFVCDAELAEHFEMSLVQVRSVPVKTRRIKLSELKVRAPKVEEVSSIEASLRLDALASAGFRVSRSKMADMVKAGDVRVNWRTASKPSADLKQGDVVSCAGKGRIEITGVTMTKKEKYSVTYKRFV